MCERALAGDDEIEPQRIGLGVRGGDDLDAVAVLELGPSGISSWLIFTATQRLPMSVCTA